MDQGLCQKLVYRADELDANGMQFMNGAESQFDDLTGTAKCRLVPFGQRLYAFRKTLETGPPTADNGFCLPPQGCLPLSFCLLWG